MYRTLLFALGLAVAFQTTGLAATAYYIGQDTKTAKCVVVDKEPDGARLQQVGPDSYKTKAEALAALKTAPECQG